MFLRISYQSDPDIGPSFTDDFVSLKDYTEEFKILENDKFRELFPKEYENKTYQLKCKLQKYLGKTEYNPMNIFVINDTELLDTRLEMKLFSNRCEVNNFFSPRTFNRNGDYVLYASKSFND